MGLPLSPEEEKNPDKVKTKIFESILRPILEGAAAAGDLPEVPPSAGEVLERAHVLRAKEGSPKPVIARFYSRDIRGLIFKHRKQFAPPQGPLQVPSL